MPARTQGRHVEGMPEPAITTMTNPRLPANTGPRLVRHRRETRVGRQTRRRAAHGKVHGRDQQPRGGQHADAGDTLQQVLPLAVVDNSSSPS